MTVPNLNQFPGMRRRAGGGRRPWWAGLLALILAGITYYQKQHAQPPALPSRTATVSREPKDAPPNTVARRQPPASYDPSQSTSATSGASHRVAPTTAPAGTSANSTLDPLPALIRAHQTNPTVVQSAGTVFKLLPDDTEGDRHQKFLVRLASGDTILIAHNIDLATRLDVQEGDAISFKGEYIWNERGGVVHWTHHDPRKRHSPGWVEVNGKTFD